jgi:hypothetical protein
LSDRSKWFRIFLATKLAVFSDPEEPLKLFSNYPSMISNTRSSSQTQRLRERARESSDLELELWVFLRVRNKSVRWGSFHCRLGRGGEGR